MLLAYSFANAFEFYYSITVRFVQSKSNITSGSFAKENLQVFLHRLQTMSSNIATSLRCPETGCEVVITGPDNGEFRDMMAIHKKSQHWKNIGCLPNEILIKIFGYLVPHFPQCSDCFQQTNIIRLAVVCKRFNELTKNPELYRELKVDYTFCKNGMELWEKCPKPPMSVVKKVIESLGAQMKRVTSDNVGVINHALEVNGSSVHEIRTTKLALVLEHASKMKFNPSALTRLVFKLKNNQQFYYCSGAFFFAPGNQNDVSYLSRIYELRIDFANVLRRQNHRIDFIVNMISLAMHSFPSLKKVTVKYERDISILPETAEIIDHFKKGLDPSLLCDPHSEIKDDDSWFAEITRKRKRKMSQENSPQDTQESFNNLLSHIGSLDQL